MTCCWLWLYSCFAHFFSSKYFVTPFWGFGPTDIKNFKHFIKYIYIFIDTYFLIYLHLSHHCYWIKNSDMYLIVFFVKTEAEWFPSPSCTKGYSGNVLSKEDSLRFMYINLTSSSLWTDTLQIFSNRDFKSFSL